MSLIGSDKTGTWASRPHDAAKTASLRIRFVRAFYRIYHVTRIKRSQKNYPPLAGSAGGVAGAVTGGVVAGAAGVVAGTVGCAAGSVVGGVAGCVVGCAGVVCVAGVSPGVAAGGVAGAAAGVAPGVASACAAGVWPMFPVPSLSLFGGLYMQIMP
jgi:hypothetical protein